MCLQVAETLMGAKGEEENVTGAKRWLHLQQALSFISLDRAAMAAEEGGDAVGKRALGVGVSSTRQIDIRVGFLGPCFRVPPN